MIRQHNETVPGRGVSVIVPVYNEEHGVGRALHDLSVTMQLFGHPYELLVVDDGSTDGSRKVIEAVEDPELRLLVHPTNQGYGAALTTGLRHARFARLVITDADSTYPSVAIPRLVTGLGDASMVVGARTASVAAMGFLRSPVRWLLRRFASHLTGQFIPDLNSGMRAIRRETLVPLIPILPTTFSWTSTITVALLLRGEKVAFQPIDYHQRTGNSKIHPVKDTLVALRCILRAFACCRNSVSVLRR